MPCGRAHRPRVLERLGEPGFRELAQLGCRLELRNGIEFLERESERIRKTPDRPRSEFLVLRLRIRVLEERLRLTRIEKYGAGGEKLPQAQMQLFELAPVVSEMIEQVEPEHAPVRRPTKGSGKHPGRQELPANLPRVERILPCTLHQLLCKRRGRETVVIGYEESSQLDVEPAKYFVLAVDAEARRRLIGPTERHALRQERAKPLLDDIRSKIEVAQSIALPSSALSKACQYALTLGRKLTRFLEYPELELSNNLAENSMRPVVLGRKNWIHMGSPQAGPKIAAILSVVESCRRLKLPVRDYLAAVLPGFADLPIRHLRPLHGAAFPMLGVGWRRLVGRG
jgi:hypothetical protein